MAVARTPVVVGTCRFRSRLFSNRWSLHRNDTVIAAMRRIPSRHISEVALDDGTLFQIEPCGWGLVIATAGDTELGRINRRSWWGRAWELTTPTFAADLTSDPLPRRWSLRIGTEPVGRLSGTVWSYNRLDVHTDVAVPVAGLTLAWHVLARPWEAASAPVALVPQRASLEAYRLHG
jgi:hypothetical protein